MRIILISAAALLVVCISCGLVLLFIFSSSQTQLSAEEYNSVQKQHVLYPSYDLDINLKYDEHRIEVIQKVEVWNTLQEPIPELVFCVEPDGYENVMILESAEITGEPPVRLDADLSKGILTIPLESDVAVGKKIAVTLKYSLNLFFIDSGDMHPYGNFAYAENVIQCGDFYPVLNPWEPGVGFRRWPFHPIGDPVVYPLADYAVQVHAGKDVIVAGYGFVSKKDNVWKFESKKARSWAFAASKEFKTLTGGTREIPITLYYYTGNEAGAAACLKAGEEAVGLFQEKFGPYPYKNLVLVENGYYSSMEYSGFCTISHSHMDLYSKSYSHLLVALTAHEIAHQWWYGGVGNDQVTEPWLDEALAQYSEYLFLAKFYPEFVSWWQQNTNVRKVANKYIDNAIFDYRDRGDYTRIIYGRAPAFIQELHRILGDDVFFAFLREYYREMTDKFATKEDFFRILSRHTDKDLTVLFAKYFRVFPDMDKWGK
ncbi:MAG: M1 family metallopeptidase [Spirochaetales bacterium]|nr:M1 family metallopeptidase [Spirochaetales bacterium]